MLINVSHNNIFIIYCNSTDEIEKKNEKLENCELSSVKAKMKPR